MRIALMTLSGASVLLAAGIFGIFLAWVCTTMWGLDAADPRIAIPAMQSMNVNVRNALFFVPFFLTAPVILLTAFVAFRAGAQGAAGYFAASGAVILVGVTLLTMTVLVPRNEAFNVLPVPEDLSAARDMWLAYSPEWQVWNAVRTLCGGVGVLLAAAAVAQLSRWMAGTPVLRGAAPA